MAKTYSSYRKTMPLELFHKNRYSVDGYHNSCKSCRKVQRKEREKILINVAGKNKTFEQRHAFFKKIGLLICITKSKESVIEFTSIKIVEVIEYLL